MKDLVERLRAALDEGEKQADTCADAFLNGDRIGMEPHNMHPSVRMFTYTWTPAKAKRLVERDRALLTSADEGQAAMDRAVLGYGLGDVTDGELIAATARLRALKGEVERAAEFWLGPETTDADH